MGSRDKKSKVNPLPKVISKEARYKAAVSVRGDCLYCPLPLAVDSYWNCLTDCHHCCFRALNRAWGTDLRPSDPDEIFKKLRNGITNKSPKSSLAWALKHKKTIRVGNRTDPYQDIEGAYLITKRIIKGLLKLNWSFVLQTRFLGNAYDWDDRLLDVCNRDGLLTVLGMISPGAEGDWEILERGRTTPIPRRLKILKRWVKRGYNVGVNGEPFIPGYHSTLEFRDMLRRLKDIGVYRYNTYNLHLNDYVAKRFVEIGLDIEKIWTMNQDHKWKPLQRKLCEIADKEGVILGCPDFVNTGPHWQEKAGTCCGVDVPNPSTFNSHYFKRDLQKGVSVKEILDKYEGIGDFEQGREILEGTNEKIYTMKDAGLVKGKENKNGFGIL